MADNQTQDQAVPTQDQALPARPSWERPSPPSRPASRPSPLRPALQPVTPRSYSPPPAASAPPATSAPPAASEPSYAAPTYAASPYSAPPLPPEPQPEAAVRYDLAGNPISSPAPGPSPYAPPAPFGYAAGPVSAAPGTWPPQPMGGPQNYRNNSGEQSHLPPEIERLRWHWGAFFFPILWTKKHGLTTIAASLAGGLFLLRMLRIVFSFINPLAFLALCIFCGVVYFGLQVYLGLNGHKIGWRNRHFPGGVEEYFKVQNAWMWWGFGINIMMSVVLPVLLVLGVIGAGLSSAHTGNSYGSGSYGSGNYGSGNYSSPSSSTPADSAANSNGSGQ